MQREHRLINIDMKSIIIMLQLNKCHQLRGVADDDKLNNTEDLYEKDL